MNGLLYRSPCIKICYLTRLSEIPSREVVSCLIISSICLAVDVVQIIFYELLPFINNFVEALDHISTIHAWHGRFQKVNHSLLAYILGPIGIEEPAHRRNIILGEQNPLFLKGVMRHSPSNGPDNLL